MKRNRKYRHLKTIKNEILDMKTNAFLKYATVKQRTIHIDRGIDIAKKMVDIKRRGLVDLIELAIAIRHLSCSKRDMWRVLLKRISHWASMVSPLKKSFSSRKGYS